MNQRYIFLMFIPLMFLISGCPIGITYPPGEPGTEKYEKALIGTWTQPDKEKEVQKIQIARIDDYSFKLTVLEKGEMYSEEGDSFTGWMTTVDGKKFIYLQEEGNKIGNYYTYCIDFVDKNLKSLDISLKEGGVDAVTSTEAFRKEISASLKYADALSSEATWTKE
ncbi:MAG: hypothetical protein ACHQFW_11095 [Chitinophagales bacterium]